MGQVPPRLRIWQRCGCSMAASHPVSTCGYHICLSSQQSISKYLRTFPLGSRIWRTTLLPKHRELTEIGPTIANEWHFPNPCRVAFPLIYLPNPCMYCQLGSARQRPGHARELHLPCHPLPARRLGLRADQDRVPSALNEISRTLYIWNDPYLPYGCVYN